VTGTETEARQSELARAVLGQSAFVYACIPGSSNGGQADRRTGGWADRQTAVVGRRRRALALLAPVLCIACPLSTDWRDLI
jgi:hypothetical protein